MTVLATEYTKAKASEKFQEAITDYDNKLIVRFNTKTQVDVILREQPSIWTDKWLNEHWCQEYLPILAIAHKDGTPIWGESCASYWIDELRRRDMRYWAKTPRQVVKEINEHNEALNIDKEADYRKKQAYEYGRRYASDFCSVTVGEKTWES